MQEIRVNWVSSATEISVELWQKCFVGKEGPWWYQALEGCGLEDQFTFSYAIISRGSEQIGIAPAFIMDVPMELVAPPKVIKLLKFHPLVGKLFPFLVYQRTLFLGSPCADEGTIGLLPGEKLSEVAGVLQDALYQRAVVYKAPMIIWKDFCEDDAEALQSLSRSHGLFKVVSYPGTGIPLADGKVDTYFKNLSLKKRHNLRKKLKRSKERLAVNVEIIQHPSGEILDDIFALFWQTYERGKTKFERLNRRFFELIAQADIAWFILLRDSETGRLVAFKLCFKLGAKVINKFIGLDYEMAENAHLYFRLWEVAVEWALANGVTEIQSGQTSYAAKFEVGHSLLPLTNYCKHRNRIIHRIYAEIAKGISWSTIDDDLKTYLTAHPGADRSSAIALL